ncbi:MAG: glycosyltransferase family 1 protein [Bacillota bacterium]
MRIGIAPALDGGGGVYQYSLTMMNALGEWLSEDSRDSLVIFTDQPSHPSVELLNQKGYLVEPLQPPLLKNRTLAALRRLTGEGPHREAWRRLRRRWVQSTDIPDPDVIRYRPEMTEWFKGANVELMLYPMPTLLSFESKIPYVAAIHDLQHRLQPEFPEVSANGEWERREYRFRNVSRYATLILADSEVGKEDILTFYGSYGVTPDRVKVLPFLPACYLAVDVPETELRRVRLHYNLPERYVFYPAQFWPHKNHMRILKAVDLIKKDYGVKIPVVFCGSYTGEIRKRTFEEVMSLSRRLRFGDQVRYLGYVPDEDMSCIYAGAVALVMPTFFGPTNIPVLEAWAFGCPVLTSDIRGIREQAGDAAVLADPRSVESIADGIYRLWTDDGLRRSLAERGRQRLTSYTPDDYRRRLVETIEEAKTRLKG